MTVEGFKFFQDAEGFSAFDINAFLMSQSVTRFDNSTDRDTALSSVLTAGMISYDKATGKLQIYDGSSWIDVATGTLTADHGALTGLADDDHPQYLTEARGDLLYAAVDVSPTITLNGDASGSVTLTNLGNGTLTVTVANDSHTHDTRYFTETEADGRYVNVSGDTMTGTLTYTLLNGPTSQTRDKIRVWNSSSYTIGMQSGYTYGHLNDYAMTFQMNNDSDRGFWWGDASHSNAQGAMSLTTNGRLTVATSISVGEGESTTGPSISTLYVGGNGWVTGPMYIGSSGDSYLYFRDSNSGAWREIFWDDSENRFRSGHSIKFDGYVHSRDNFYVGDNGMGDSDIYFYDDNTNTWRTMRWDDSANDWAVEDNGGTMRKLYHSGNIPSYLSTSGGTISGSLVVTSTIDANEYYGDNGAANDPSFTFQSDQDTGIYRYTTNQIGFTTGGGYRGRIASDGLHLASGDWFRSYGSTGWYNGTYGGGMYMADSEYVRVYNNKAFWIDRQAGTAWNDSTLLLDTANGTASIAFHTGGVAPQFRVGHNYSAVYLRNSADSGWSTLIGVISNQSSRKDKQDITDFRNVPSSLSSDADAEYARYGLDLVKQLRPVSYRWKRDGHLDQIPLSERRANALMKLQRIRKKAGMEPFVNDEFYHLCGRDCDGSEEQPCVRVRDWQNGSFGFIAEEVGEVAPELGTLDSEGNFSSIDNVGLTAVAVAAIQELSAKVEALEAQLQGA